MGIDDLTQGGQADPTDVTSCAPARGGEGDLPTGGAAPAPDGLGMESHLPAQGARTPSFPLFPSGLSGARLVDASPFSTDGQGEQIASYQVLGVLGEGGMGRVYKALDPALGRLVALKVIKRAGSEGLEAFFQEARAQARVEHPFVAKVHAIGESNQEPFIAMQYVEGGPLIKELERLSLEEKVRIFAETCEGVHAAHRLGIIHRDLKPGNILVERDADGQPHPVVLDFGLAVLPENGPEAPSEFTRGTPRYMSPEQVEGRSLDRRTDVYSLGVSFYESLCGRAPFQAENAQDLLHQVAEQEVPRPRTLVPDLPRDLETILLKCLEKLPSDRYESARALGEDLHRFLEGEPILARPATRRERLIMWIQRNRVLAGVVAASAVIILVTSTFALLLVVHGRAQARAAAIFNQESERQEALLARTYGMPFHDVSNVEDQVRSDLERLRGRLRGLGRDAEGPGLLAMGRAHRILGDLQEAHSELQRAWDRGYRVPEVAEELGMVKAALFRRLLMPRAGTDRLESHSDLDRRYRKPALELLRFANQAGVNRSFHLAKAEQALTEERFDEALQLARQAREEQAWLWESSALEAEVYMMKAMQASDGQGFQEAERLLGLAGEALAQAREIGRSAPPLFLLEARRRAQLLRAKVEAGQGGAGSEWRDWALEACSQAQQVRPRSWEAATCRSLVHLCWAPQLSIQKQDPRSELWLGIEAAHQALSWRPDNNETLDTLAFLWWRVAMADEVEGKDPRLPMGMAVAALERAFKDPGLAHHLHHRMGLCYTTQAIYDLNHGVDPSDALGKAELHFRESYRLMEVGQPLSDLLWALGVRAQGMVWAHSDPTPVLEEAEKVYRLCRRLIPHYFFAQVNLANITLLRAEYLLGMGRDPSADLQHCQELGAAAEAERPGVPYSQVILGRVAMLKGVLAARQGRPSGGFFAEAQKALGAAAAQRQNRPEFIYWPLLLRWEQLRCSKEWDEAFCVHLEEDLDAARRKHPRSADLAALSARVEAQAARRGDTLDRVRRREQAEALMKVATALNGNLMASLQSLDKAD